MLIFSSFKIKSENIAVKNTDDAPIIETLDAVVYDSDRFSKYWYKLIPHILARKNINSCFKEIGLINLGLINNSVIYPSKNLKNIISIGVKYFNKTFVATKVVPHTKIDINANI